MECWKIKLLDIGSLSTISADNASVLWLKRSILIKIYCTVGFPEELDMIFLHIRNISKAAKLEKFGADTKD